MEIFVVIAIITLGVTNIATYAYCNWLSDRITHIECIMRDVPERKDK